MGRGQRWRLAAVAVFFLTACGGFEGTSPDEKVPTRVTKLGESRVISESDPNFRKYEMPEKEGECAQAEDCSSAGCSAEVCTTTKQALETMTYCSEEHPGEDFYCTCVQSRCRWQQDPAVKGGL
jgi:hypothetical protein